MIYPDYRNNVPLDLAGARAVRDEFIPLGCREADLDHELAIHHEVHCAVQTQPRDVKRVVLARCIPARTARSVGVGADTSGMQRQRGDGHQGGERVSRHELVRLSFLCRGEEKSKSIDVQGGRRSKPDVSCIYQCQADYANGGCTIMPVSRERRCFLR